MTDALEGLLPWATETQARYVEATIEHGSMRAASRALDVHHTTIMRAMKRLRDRAARAGYAPDNNMVHTVPDGYVVKGVSTYFGKDGQPTGQWVKSQLDKERHEELLRAAYAAMAEELPRVEPVPCPKGTLAKLHNVYTLTDSHVGMLSWAEETGEDWDLGIAEKTLLSCFEQMVMGAPAAVSCTVNQLGDFLHFDSFKPETPSSGHVLDADSRFEMVVQTAVRILRRVIEMALVRHETVNVVMAEGNHDMASSVWLRVMFAALFEHEDRVTVNQSPLPYYVKRHGQTMLCFHHGHLKKKAGLPMLFASRFSSDWGETKHRYCHTGHYHHTDIKEDEGMTVIQHRTLAANDAYAARGGWISNRSATAYTYHEDHGEVASNTVTPEMIDAG